MSNGGTGTQPQKRAASGFINSFTEWSLNWIPDSMVFVIALTFIVFFMGLGLTKHGPIELIDDYAKGFWLLLTFAMQMSILMITGFVIADSGIVKRGLVKLVEWPQSAKTTILVYTMFCGVVTWLHWGVGLMLCIMMGREVAVRKRGLGIHYPFIPAVGYGVLVIMANGPSQAAPLLLATPGHFLEKMTGVVPISQTAFAPYLLTLMLILFVTMPLLMLLTMPKKEDAAEIPEAVYKEFTYSEPEGDTKALRPAERWDRSKLLQSVVALAILFWAGKFIAAKGIGKLDLNTLNFAFFGLGLLLHGSPHSFIASVKKGVMTTYGVIIQFPLYAGIFGIISNSGLAAVITKWFVSVSTPDTYPWIIFLYTGLMDFFVPSAGSKFVIEAPYIIPAGQQLGVSVPQVIIAYCTGAQWVNCLQPFWALPILAAFRVRFQDILPFTFIIWLYVGVLCTFWFLVFPRGF